MIRIGTTDIQVGDVIATSTLKGMVTKVPNTRYRRFLVEVDGTPVYMTDCGSVELLSDLGDRTPCESFGRW